MFAIDIPFKDYFKEINVNDFTESYFLKRTVVQIAVATSGNSKFDKKGIL